MGKATIKSDALGFQLERMENPLFSKSKIYVMYHGRNPNGTIISKNAVERALHTIKNIPIVGEFSSETSNFKGHGGTLEMTEEGIEFVHTTSPIGVIPESAKVYWETIKDEKDLEREYLIVDGAYMWNRYEKQVSALKKDNYGQSMEIEVIDGDWIDEENAFDITDFVFSAFCVLGIDKDGAGKIEPAFSDAKIITYNNKGFKEELDEMLKEFKFSLNQEEKGVYSLELEKLLEKKSLTVEELKEKGIDPEDFESMEDLEAKIDETFAEKEDEKENPNAPDEQITEVTMGDGQIEDDKDAEDMAENKVIKDVTTNVTEGAVDGGAGDTATVLDVDTSGTDTGTQTTTANTASDGDGTQVTDANFESLNDELTKAKERISELEELVQKYEKKEHETKAKSLIEKFMKNFGLEDNDVNALDIHEFSIDNLESKLFEIVGRKALEKKDEEKESTSKFSLDVNKDDEVPYASLFEKIKK